ncbi:hypothetical protein B0I72DRAFT_165277 [Yarrowia lipolytica]|jgi:hypothetical protein|uniref:YALI0B18370p n=2 Tax=Yarrowia lipolytica TaxID=4952 RepID=Q6CE58_YARLI|nr:YALI0B18370p [Yarrowia lipolytica CLIB122]KAB8280738.1 hypothetical protein BKA91DRAFT_169963 [Yarrowia lipolytica]KAE8169823.1 hypothetical protein BKA90DRAFT_170681 [Yarrowia lipolytica]KAJ8052670.1 hypothetical protein LXG23DRAFT_38708 [Yarrowia lipolytica]QNP96852.1 Hypothetical protein YALI2_C00505g [Yarrowia lipolytica]RDW24724.1 hypothetical protein B0I71DRAFT_121105 [Yarrowia lipolytica]|eukprot:XP_501054.1 YALI0B18370p [Yarrowia lipolytica CLIB122]
MVRISKLATVACLSVVSAAPAAEDTLSRLHLLTSRHLAQFPSEDQKEITKRFIDDFHAVAVQERAISDVLTLIDLFGDITTKGIKFFTQSFTAFWNGDKKTLSQSITTFLLQAQGFLNDFVSWLQSYNGLGGFTKIFADIFIKSGLKSFITTAGLAILQLTDSILNSDWSAQSWAADLKNLQNTLKSVSQQLAAGFPTIENVRDTILYSRNAIRGLLGLPEVKS